MMSSAPLDLTNQPGPLGKLLRYSDFSTAIVVVMVIAMMLLPLPTQLLDLFVTCNIAGALLIVVVSMYTREALEFSSFPTVLLFTTLFRLAINISVTRLILTHGNAGSVIHAFGHFVVGGNLVVGIVVFLILVIIQFVVITSGAGRVAEVGARFTLDAMPGKQMAIDADLNAGQITDAEARERRLKIQHEADFYGAMDGASKFVRGDAVAGLIIVAVNLFAGIVIGVVQQGLTFSDAIQTFSTLTIGDGIAAQIPALLISTATGLIVTRAAGTESLGFSLAGQLFARPRPLFTAGAVIGALAIVPGMPHLPFLIVGGVVAGFGWTIRRGLSDGVEREEAATKVAQARPALQSPESVRNALPLDVLELEIGYGLIPLVDENEGGELLKRVSLVRRQMAAELGLVLAPIRIRDNVQLASHSYAIRIKGAEVARCELVPGSLLAMDPGDADPSLDGVATVEPAFGLPALWIAASARERAETLGYTVVDPASVIITHLTETIRQHADELLSRQDAKLLLDGLKERHPVPVEELVPDLLSVGEVHRVLCTLLAEGISIRDLVTIIETLGDRARLTKDPALLGEYCRQSLSRQITAALIGPNGSITAITLDPTVEDEVVESIVQTPDGSYLGLDPGRAEELVESLRVEVDRVAGIGARPVVLCSARLRRHLRSLIAHALPRVPVVSYHELAPNTTVDTVGVVGAPGAVAA
jgi:flagellar biosynthesis protein FlhA